MGSDGGINPGHEALDSRPQFVFEGVRRVEAGTYCGDLCLQTFDLGGVGGLLLE